MSIQVNVHASRFPDAVHRDLLRSLRTRRVPPKFHYDSLGQSQQWLALHQTHSPARTDPACPAIYDALFTAAVNQLKSRRVPLVGLGCGGGEKEARLIQILHRLGHRPVYAPCDVSLALVLVACLAASTWVRAGDCQPWVGDLLGMDDWTVVVPPPAADVPPRLITFFGLLPNLEPKTVLPRLARLVRPQDWLLCSANLLPGPDFQGAIRRILPQYDNSLTRQWLLSFIRGLGVKRTDGQLQFGVEAGSAGGRCPRITAHFHFQRSCSIQVGRGRFDFLPGERIQLFFSYRYTPDQVCRVLGRYGLRTLDSWITPSGEEGVFLCRNDSEHRQGIQHRLDPGHLVRAE